MPTYWVLKIIHQKLTYFLRQLFYGKIWFIVLVPAWQLSPENLSQNFFLKTRPPSGSCPTTLCPGWTCRASGSFRARTFRTLICSWDQTYKILVCIPLRWILLLIFQYLCLLVDRVWPDVGIKCSPKICFLKNSKWDAAIAHRFVCASHPATPGLSP